ncbi:MAG TPA: hypothetical protein VF062_20050 [Candidatus Limnocylindrales bacterium]
MPLSDSFAMACDAAASIAAKCTGSFLDRVTSASTGSRSLVDISLSQVAEHGEVAFSFERIWYAAFSNLDNLEASFVDEVVVSRLSGQSDEWPDIPRRTIKVFDGMPDLVYFHLRGPVELVVIAAIVSVLKA